MARKQRIQYPGAVYHVISRGNYRKELFLKENTGAAFERALMETVERSGWKLHAYVIMSNHYHLAVETPEPNLVDGMKWLQSTFATRFNRLRNERGPVFQGRYKSILIGEERPLLGLVDYIHLNPVRAGIRPLETLRDYTLSSYPKYFKRTPVDGLCREDFLGMLELPSSLAGMNRYAKHLELSEAKDPKRRAALTKQYCRGWFIGSKEEKKALAKDMAEKHPDVDWEGADLQALNEAQWDAVVCAQMRRIKQDEASLLTAPKGAAWKIEIARLLRKQTTAKNGWIAKRLNMGHPSRVSNLIQNKV